MEYGSILEHPLVDMSKETRKRIEGSVSRYKGEVENITFRNSSGHTAQRRKKKMNFTKKAASYLTEVVGVQNTKVNLPTEEAVIAIGRLFPHSFFDELGKWLEMVLATGGAVIRPRLSGNKIDFDFFSIDNIYPVKGYDIEEGVILSKKVNVKIGGKEVFLTILEIHRFSSEEGRTLVENELYHSHRHDVLGERVPMSSFFPDVEEAAVSPFSRTYAFLANVGFNNKEPDSKLPLGVADNSVDIIEQLDDTFEQFGREIKMGKRRIVVGSGFLKNKTSNRGVPEVYFDPEDDVFQSLRSTENEMPLKDVTTDIRSDSFITSLRFLIRLFEAEIGVTVDTFSVDREGVRTATEVIKDNSTTFRKREKIVSSLEKFIKEIIRIVVEMGEISGLVSYGTSSLLRELEIDLGDGLLIPFEQNMENISKAVNMNLMPRIEGIQRLFKITEDEAREWLHTMRMEEIHSDPGFRAAMASVSLFGQEEVAQRNALDRMIELS